MARRRWIFGRGRNREPEAGSGREPAPEDGTGEITDVQPGAIGSAADADPVAEPEAEAVVEPDADAREAVESDESDAAAEPDADAAAEWDPDSVEAVEPNADAVDDAEPVADDTTATDPGRPLTPPDHAGDDGSAGNVGRQPAPAPQAVPPARRELRRGDTGERIRIAADQAAQAAEMRAMDEIIALEDDLERASSSADAATAELRDRVEAAERGAAEAERRAQEAEREREEAEERAKEQATEWLRRQVDSLRAEARQRVKAEVERVRAETEVAIRTEAEERLRARAATLEAEAEQRISRQAEAADRGAETGAPDELAAERHEREAAAAALTEALGQLAEAEARPAEAERTPAEPEPAVQARGRETTEIEDLRRELELAREQAAAAEQAGSGASEEARRELSERVAEAEARTREEILAEVERSADARERELRERAESAAARVANERIERIRAEAEERVHDEVAVARKAAEEKFAQMLAERELELERERTEKVRVIEDSHGRLAAIEERAVEATERVTLAEQRLAEEARRLRAEAEQQRTIDAERAEAETAKAFAAREAELERTRAELERAGAEADERIAAAAAAAERKAEAAVVRADSAEDAVAGPSLDARAAAAEWLSGQVEALRTEGALAARDGHDAALAEARAAGAAETEERLREEYGRDRAQTESEDARRADEAVASERAKLSARLQEINAGAGADAPEAETAAPPPEAGEGIDRPATPDVPEPDEPTPVERPSRLRFSLRPRRGKPDAPAATESPEEPDTGSPTEEAEQRPSGKRRRRVWSPPTGPSPTAAGPVRLADADFEQLRGVGMSVAQAKSLLRYRDERGLTSVAEIGSVPGFSRSFLDQLGDKLID